MFRRSIIGQVENSVLADSDTAPYALEFYESSLGITDVFQQIESKHRKKFLMAEWEVVSVSEDKVIRHWIRLVHADVDVSTCDGRINAAAATHIERRCKSVGGWFHFKTNRCKATQTLSGRTHQEYRRDLSSNSFEPWTLKSIKQEKIDTTISCRKNHREDLGFLPCNSEKIAESLFPNISLLKA